MGPTSTQNMLWALATLYGISKSPLTKLKEIISNFSISFYRNTFIESVA
jgi:hypothetical protein